MAFSGSVVLRADGSSQIGLGHLIRSLSLLQEFHLSGWKCAIAYQAEVSKMALEQQIFENLLADIDLIGLKHGKELCPDILKSTGFGDPDILIIDHYQLGQAFESIFSNFGTYVVVFDDLADRRHHCDTIINAGAGHEGNTYKELVPKHCQVLTGGEFNPLRPDFSSNRRKSLQRSRFPISHIVVALGGTDANGETLPILRALAHLHVTQPSFSVNTIMSTMAQQLGMIREFHDSAPANWSLSLNVEDMANPLMKADLVIGSLGVSCWERACLGIPSIAVLSAENQRANATMLEARNAAIIISAGPKVEDEIIVALQGLMANSVQLEKQSTAAAELCDGQGCERITKAVLSHFKNRKSMTSVTLPVVQLRDIGPNDCSTIFQWQQIPEVRRFARIPDLPSWQEHSSWFARRIESIEGNFFMIEFDEEPVGFVRLDPASDQQGFEVSISVAPHFQGNGYALSALNALREKLPKTTFSAFIKRENTSSMALFKRAGYEHTPQNGWLVSRA
jgi:UDP-2,4-diacetamido-2,4,6-trideoxy-beta-L-altropyranose hydrolase